MATRRTGVLSASLKLRGAGMQPVAAARPSATTTARLDRPRVDWVNDYVKALQDSLDPELPRATRSNALRAIERELEAVGVARLEREIRAWAARQPKLSHALFVD